MGRFIKVIKWVFLKQLKFSKTHLTKFNTSYCG